MNSPSLVFFYKRLVGIGGAEKLLIGECNALCQLGHAPTVISYYIHEDILSLFDPRVKIVVLGVSKKRNNFFDLGCMLRLFKFVGKRREEIYITASGIFEIYLCKLLFGISFSIEAHHPIIMMSLDSQRSSYQAKKNIDKYYPESWSFNRHNERKPSLMVSSIEFFIYQNAFQKARNVYVLSEFSKIEKSILYSVNSIVLHGAVTSMPPLFESIEAKIEDGIGPVKVISICRISPEKNLDVLIKSVVDLNAVNKNGYLLDIYGEGPDKGKLLKLVSQLNAHEFIKFGGFLPEEEFPQKISEADIFVYIEYADYAITVFEAMCYGCQILCYKGCWIPEALIPLTGIALVDIDTKNISDGIVKLSNNSLKDRQKYMRETGRTIRELTWTARAQNLLDIEFGYSDK